MTYYVGNMPAGEHLAHYGTKGMKWGRRLYQNPDGSLTAAGRVHYGVTNAYGRARRGVSNAYSSARSGARKASGRASKWYNKNKKTIRNVAIGVGTAAAIGGAAYLGYKNRGRIKAAARSFNALRKQRSNAIKGYKQFGFDNRGLTKFDKARIDLMRNAGSKASHLKYAAGNKARAIGYKTNAFRAKAKVNAGEVIGKAKSNLGKKASHLKYAAGNKARAVGYKANAFKAKAKVNAGEAINKAKGKAKNFIADSRTRRAAKNSGKGYEAIRKKLNPQKVSGISNRMRHNVERLNNPAYQRRIRNAKAFGKGAAIGLGSAAAGLGAQALYDRYGRNRKLKSKRYKHRHSN